MNKNRREVLSDALDQLRDLLEGLEETRDNIPENLQEGDLYQTCECEIDVVEQAINELEELI